MSRVAQFAPAIPPQAREVLLSLLGDRSGTLKASERGEVRRVSSPHFPRPVVVKRYPPRGLLRTAGRGIRGSAARREFDACQRLADRGVAAVRALGFFEVRSGHLLGESFVLLEDLGPLPTLAEALHGASPRERRRLLESAGSIAADLHGAGLLHGDLHAGNLFVLPGGALALADLARSRRAAGTLRARGTDLGFLLHSLRGFGRFERCRSLLAYARRARLSFRRIARAALRAASRRGRARSLSAARHAREAVYGRTAALPPGWRGMSYGARSAAFERALASVAGNGLVQGEGTLLVRRLPRGEAERAFGELHRCAALGLPVGLAVAWFERVEGGESFLAVEVAGPFSPLAAALPPARGRHRAALLGSLGRLARLAHDAGLRFGGVSADALLAGRQGGVLLAWPLGIEARPLRSLAARRVDLEAVASALPVRLSSADRARVVRAYDPFGHLFPSAAGLRSP